MKLVDLTGQRFGKFVVVECAGRDKHKNAVWLCLCDCGKTATVVSGNLRTGHTTSCGCERVLATKMANTRHGYAGRGEKRTRLYAIWNAMNARCGRTGSSKDIDYGGRGITVCSEWKRFEPFAAWAMKNGYSSELSIDRIDVNGHYCPENCRWATALEQANNTRKNRYVDYHGERVTVSELSRITKVPYKALYRRLVTDGWEMERATTERINARCAF